MTAFERLLACALLGFTAASCRTVEPQGSTPAAAEHLATGSRVVSLCFATQGNGYNWAATASWMSETLRIHVEAAEKMLADGQGPVLFDLGCVSGSSSGSLVTNVYSALLGNAALLKNRAHPELYTVEEATKIADGLRWMALSADMSTFSYLNTLGQVITEWVYSRAERHASRTPQFKELWALLLGEQPPSWWDGSYVDAEQILVDFAANTQVAGRISHATVQERDEWGRLIHFPYFAQLSEIPRDNREAETVDRDLGRRAKRVNEITESFLTSQFPLGEYLRRYQRGVYPPAKGPLVETVEARLPEGACTLTMGAMFTSLEVVPMDKLPYESLRPIVLCDESTIAKMLAVDSFARDIEAPDAYAARFVFMAVKNRRASLALSLREPRMMRELLGEAGDGRIEITGFFDPQNEVHRHARRLFPIDRLKVGVTGGYLDRRANAWAISYYHESRLQQLEAKGHQVISRIALFGKPDKDRAKKFDTVVIKELFSRSEGEAKTNLDDWYGLQMQFCATRAEALRERYDTRVSTTVVNWDIAKRPAAYAGKSRLIAYKSANATRLQTEGAPPKVVFDPMPETPEPIQQGPIPCYQ
jgi:hypothetical protein